jgi:hypothetical protein
MELEDRVVVRVPRLNPDLNSASNGSGFWFGNYSSKAIVETM